MACRTLLGQLARTQGFCVLDDFDLPPHDVHLLSDGYLHPNDAGFAPYARRLLALLAPHLPPAFQQ